jgi:hypothetical protein
MWIFIAFGTCFVLVAVVMLYRSHRRLQSKEQLYNISPRSQDKRNFGASAENGKPFEGKDIDFCNSSVASDNSSYASSQASSSKRKSKNLRKPRKKKYSTLARTLSPVEKRGLNGPEPDKNDRAPDDRDGLIKPSKGGQSTIATRNVIDTTAIFSEIDLGDDYGVNLVV